MTSLVNSRSIIHLTAKMNGISYVIGTLAFNNREISYFFVDKRKLSQKFLNCDNGKMNSPLEHITWHSNRVHIKRKNGVIAEEIYYQYGPFISERPIITPFYVESIYFNDTPCLVQLSEFDSWQGSQSQEVLAIDNSKGFSMIFILVPASESTHSILTGIQREEFSNVLSRKPQLADLLDENHRAGRINTPWENWDMLVVMSSFLSTIRSPIPDHVKPAYRTLNYKDVRAALTDLTAQAAFL